MKWFFSFRIIKLIFQLGYYHMNNNSKREAFFYTDMLPKTRLFEATSGSLELTVHSR